MNLEPNNLEPRDVMLLNAIDHISTMLGCVANAVSNLAPKSENYWADSDYVEIDADTRVLEEAGRTDWLTTTLADGDMRGTVTTWHETLDTGFYLSTDGDLHVANPDELRALAARLRSVYAPAFDAIAAMWESRRDAGEIPTREAKA